MAIVGPWAIAVYKDAIDWGVVPVPTEEASPPTRSRRSATRSRSPCTPPASTGDCVGLVKFATSEEPDGELLELTGQMPMRTDLPAIYADYFAANPDYVPFAEQADRTVEVPNVPNSIEIWQTFRDAWTASVVFGDEPIDKALRGRGRASQRTLAQGECMARQPSRPPRPWPTPGRDPAP